MGTGRIEEGYAYEWLETAHEVTDKLFEEGKSDGEKGLKPKKKYPFYIDGYKKGLMIWSKKVNKR